MSWDDDRWFVLLLVLVFAVLMAFGLLTTGRARRVVSVLALAVALFTLLAWWQALVDVLAEADIATNSGPITLGPGMSWTAATAGLQVLAAVLLVVAAFSRPPRGPPPPDVPRRRDRPSDRASGREVRRGRGRGPRGRGR